MKRMAVGLALVFGLAAGQASAADTWSGDQFWLTPNAGTLGAGIEAGWRWSDNWGARAGINGFSTSFVYHQKNSDLHDRLTLLNAGLTADYYPFAGDFRLSGGARIAANKIHGEMRNLRQRKNGSFSIIDDPLTRFTATQNTFQPYIGTGYSVQIKERVSLNFDLGALYAGTPELSVVSHADRFGISRHSINNEIDRARDRIAPFKILPVIQIGLNIRF